MIKKDITTAQANGTLVAVAPYLDKTGTVPYAYPAVILETGVARTVYSGRSFRGHTNHDGILVHKYSTRASGAGAPEPSMRTVAPKEPEEAKELRQQADALDLVGNVEGAEALREQAASLEHPTQEPDTEVTRSANILMTWTEYIAKKGEAQAQRAKADEERRQRHQRQEETMDALQAIIGKDGYIHRTSDGIVLSQRAADALLAKLNA